MPTPFMHLHIAEEIKHKLQDRPEYLGASGHDLADDWPAFYLGSVAPDYQVLCGVAREVTHFYKLPPDPENQAYPRMLKRYPGLADVNNLPSAHAVFVAAYAAHLMLDLIWFRQIVVPMFYNKPQLGDIQQRHLLHLILLTYLDKLAFEVLPNSAGSILASVKPDNWLPFATDEELHQWRDFLVPQLVPGGSPLTVEIYAGRLQMTPEAFTAKLDDGEWLKDNLFAQVPVSDVQQKLTDAVPASIRLIKSYLNGELVQHTVNDLN
jgi:hypothetical protein